ARGLMPALAGSAARQPMLGNQAGGCAPMTHADRGRFGLAVLLGLVALHATGAYADAYPNRPVRLIVPFAAGGLNDVVARLVDPSLERPPGHPFITDTRRAAGAIVGPAPPARAMRAAHTLLMVASSFAVAPATHPKLPYDPARDLAPIAMVAKN